MHPTPAASPTDAHRPRATAALLVGAAVMQLLGQALLRLTDADGGPGTPAWVVSHVVLVVAAVALVCAMTGVALVVGTGPLTGLGLVLLVGGQALSLAVLAIDLDLASPDVHVIRTLDSWDFIGIAGAVLLLLELRRRRGVQPGVDLALIGLAVPALDGLVLVAAGAVVVGFAALAHSLLTTRGHGAYAWLGVVTVVAYVVAGTVSWQRAALALLVLAWTVVQLRASTRREAVS